ncbi:SDR family oxidoreductase [Novosphingobium sp.]|uniref:SDR family oxidoreductase n=1 Tax=Novosphingobium sp. TaxID=1874826 RepID=UPI003BAB0B37
MPSVVITGANRGLGLEFTRQFLATGWTVHAGVRRPAQAANLAALADAESLRLNIHAIDLSDFVSIERFAAGLGDAPIDLLINNAGIMDVGASDFSEKNRHSIQVLGLLDHEAWAEVFRTNVLGTTSLTEALLPHLAAGKDRKIVMISSIMGSITACATGSFPPGGGLYLYRSTKAALNMVTRNMAADLARGGFTVIAVNPGWVRTDMGGADAMFDPAISVGNMIAMITGATTADNGSFISHDGARLPW